MSKAAVYGSLKQGKGNHGVLGGSNYLGTDWTLSEYTMYDMGYFPCIVEGGNTKVLVEVYDVDEYTMERLDCLEGFPSFYNRKLINTRFGETWMYYIADKSTVEHLDEVLTGVW